MARRPGGGGGGPGAMPGGPRGPRPPRVGSIPDSAERLLRARENAFHAELNTLTVACGAGNYSDPKVIAQLPDIVSDVDTFVAAQRNLEDLYLTNPANLDGQAQDAEHNRLVTEMDAIVTKLKDGRERIVVEKLEQSIEGLDSDDLKDKKKVNAWVAEQKKAEKGFVGFEKSFPDGIDLAVIAPDTYSEFSGGREIYVRVIENLASFLSDKDLPDERKVARLAEVIKLKKKIEVKIAELDRAVFAYKGLGVPKVEAAPAAGAADPVAAPPATPDSRKLGHLSKERALEMVSELERAAQKLVGNSDPKVVAEKARLEAEAQKWRARLSYTAEGPTSLKVLPDLNRARVFMAEAKKPANTPEEKAEAHKHAKEAWRHTKPAYDAAEAKYEKLFAEHAKAEAAASEGRVFNKKLSNPALEAALRDRDEARQLYQESLSVLHRVRLENKKELVKKTQAEVLTNSDAVLHKMPGAKFDARIQNGMRKKLIDNPLKVKTEAQEKALAEHPGIIAGAIRGTVSRITTPFVERLYDEKGKLQKGRAAALGAVGVGSLALVGLSFPAAAATAVAGFGARYFVVKLSEKLGSHYYVKKQKGELVQMQEGELTQMLGNTNIAELEKARAEQMQNIKTREKRVRWGSQALGAAAGFYAGYEVKVGLGEQINNMMSARGAELPPRPGPGLRDPGEMEYLRRPADTVAAPGLAIGQEQYVPAESRPPAPPPAESVSARPGAEALTVQPPVEGLPHIVDVKTRDNLWTIVQREYAVKGNNFQGITPGQRDRILMEVFNETNNDSTLKTKIGLEARGGKPQDVHWIYDKQKVDVGPLLEKLDEKVRAVRGVARAAVPVPPPIEPPVAAPVELPRVPYVDGLRVDVGEVVPPPVAPDASRAYPNPGSGDDVWAMDRPSDGPRTYDADYVPVDPGEAVPTVALQERAPLVAQALPQGDADMREVAAEMAGRERLLMNATDMREVIAEPARAGRFFQAEDAFDEVANPPVNTPEVPVGEVDGVQQMEAVGTRQAPLSIADSQPGSRTFRAAVEAMGGQNVFSAAREELIASIESEGGGVLGRWWRVLTSASENSLLTKFGDQPLSEFYALRQMPRLEVNKLLESEGMSRSMYDAWMRAIGGLSEAVTENGRTTIDLNKTTLDQLVNYAVVRGAKLSAGT